MNMDHTAVSIHIHKHICREIGEEKGRKAEERERERGRGRDTERDRGRRERERERVESDSGVGRCLPSAQLQSTNTLYGVTAGVGSGLGTGVHCASPHGVLTTQL